MRKSNIHVQVLDIRAAWKQFTQAIDQADAEGQKLQSADGHAECNALRNYSSHEQPWRLANLLGRETANERKHRHGTEPRSFPVGDAAKLHLMSAAAYGATLKAAPSSTLFLTMRPTAAEAEVIGYLCRATLSAEWRNTVESIDYSKLMQE